MEPRTAIVQSPSLKDLGGIDYPHALDISLKPPIIVPIFPISSSKPQPLPPTLPYLLHGILHQIHKFSSSLYFPPQYHSCANLYRRSLREAVEISSATTTVFSVSASPLGGHINNAIRTRPRNFFPLFFRRSVGVSTYLALVIVVSCTSVDYGRC